MGAPGGQPQDAVHHLPSDGFPPWQLVYYYFRRWKADGTLESLNWALNIRERRRQGKEDSPSMLSIGTQPVKVGPFISLETGVDGNKKVNGRKRHVGHRHVGAGVGRGGARGQQDGRGPGQPGGGAAQGLPRAAWRRSWPTRPTRRCSWAGWGRTCWAWSWR